MVRAAASGAIDYSKADPDDINWRIRHRLVLKEVRRKAEEDVTHAIHQHWLGYVGHGNLTPESYEKVRDYAGDALTSYENMVFPWLVEAPATTTTISPTGQKVTIDEATQRLIEAYKQQFKTKKQ